MAQRRPPSAPQQFGPEAEVFLLWGSGVATSSTGSQSPAAQLGHAPSTVGWVPPHSPRSVGETKSSSGARSLADALAADRRLHIVNTPRRGYIWSILPEAFEALRC